MRSGSPRGEAGTRTAVAVNAAFFAGFQLDEHTAHQLYIDRYPLGREATISWPTPDLVITNDWDASALVKVLNATDSITVSIYSTSFDRRVEESTSDPFDFTEPKTRYVATEGVLRSFRKHGVLCTTVVAMDSLEALDILRGRHDSIRKNIDEAAALHREAEAKLADYQIGRASCRERV